MWISVLTYSVIFHKLSLLHPCLSVDWVIITFCTGQLDNQKTVRGLSPGKALRKQYFLHAHKAMRSAGGHTVKGVTIFLSEWALLLEGILGNCPCADRKYSMEHSLTQRSKISTWRVEVRGMHTSYHRAANALLIFSIWITSTNLHTCLEANTTTLLAFSRM